MSEHMKSIMGAKPVLIVRSRMAIPSLPTNHAGDIGLVAVTNVCQSEEHCQDLTLNPRMVSMSTRKTVVLPWMPIAECAACEPRVAFSRAVGDRGRDIAGVPLATFFALTGSPEGCPTAPLADVLDLEEPVPDADRINRYSSVALPGAAPA